MPSFTPVASTLGGLLIGGASALLLVFNGRIAGISGITGRLWTARGEGAWRFAFVAGLLVGGLVFAWASPQSFGRSPASMIELAVAGLLVGVGTQVGAGCTSGHGVCGMSRLSVRSIVATCTFMAVAGVVVWLRYGVFA